MQKSNQALPFLLGALTMHVNTPQSEPFFCMGMFCRDRERETEGAGQGTDRMRAVTADNGQHSLWAPHQSIPAS